MKTVILRLYEAYGGHARATVRISKDIPVSKVFLTNLLEDKLEELEVTRNDDKDYLVSIEFRGFQVNTLQLVLNHEGKRWVSFPMLLAQLMFTVAIVGWISTCKSISLSEVKKNSAQQNCNNI